METAWSLQCTDIRKSYGSLEILRQVSFSVKKGEVVCIAGPSGAGKSTLLHIAGTLDRPDSGDVVIDGQTLAGMSDRALSAFRNRHIGFIFQFHHLLPEFTALENAGMPGFIAGKPESSVRSRAGELLEFLGLSGRADHKPSELSGGEQQRVAVARALVNGASLILADEPSGNLDSANAADLHRLFFDLRREFGHTFVIVTHNEELAAQADRTLYMKDGRFVS